MAEQTSIEWTQSTWNPVTGCTKLSAGCDHCYAERFAERFRGVPGHPYEPGFDLTLRPERVDQPRTWRRPRLIFVNSMSDLFHEGVPRKYIGRVFDTMETADWHIFQVLTKRSSRMRNFVNDRYPGHPAPPHIWLGTSIENARTLGRLTAPQANQRFDPVPLARAAAWPSWSARPCRDPLGHRRRRERAGSPTRSRGMAALDPRHMPHTDRGVLLQAVGRSLPEVRRQQARWPPMARVPEHRRSRTPGRIARGRRCTTG